MLSFLLGSDSGICEEGNNEVCDNDDLEEEENEFSEVEETGDVAEDDEDEVEDDEDEEDESGDDTEEVLLDPVFWWTLILIGLLFGR